MISNPAYWAHKRRRARQRVKRQVARYAEATLNYKSSEASISESPFEVKQVLFNAIETNRRKH